MTTSNRDTETAKMINTSEWILMGRISFSDEMRRVLNDIAVLSMPRTCLSCGARQNADGSLPCDH